MRGHQHHQQWSHVAERTAFTAAKSLSVAVFVGLSTAEPVRPGPAVT